ncbi:gluconokinase [Nostoc sp. LEGE 06077]|uniref:gluconokinase n=1 Tax=Nostoc sp. LEGE 06077 TaxID=915325 RepID=UPI00187E5D1E|nr:gluconokinase [Nostoc sp. LEGE 06077]MBE9209392.1 gluconokinase [Nostoc sp. LEGE 06077]
MIILIMGVAGSGKTTIGQALAAAKEWEFHDADTFHSANSKAKMSRGEPLSDIDRQPWLQSLQIAIAKWLQADKNVILACSALKASYRQFLCGDDPRVKLIYLTGNYELIEQRLRDRHGHFMQANLLQSQFDTLEAPNPDEAIYIDISQDLSAIVQQIRNCLNV